MTNGIKAWRQLQMSREATQGTPTSDFTVWRGLGVPKDDRENVFPAEDVGIFGGTDRQYFPKLGASVELEEVEATFEQIPHIFDAGIRNASPTADTGGTGYIRDYVFPIQSSDAAESSDLQTYSFKGGDNNEVEKFGFGFVTDFSLSGASGKAWMVSATFAGRELANDSDGFETGLTLPTVEEMLFGKTKLYIDPSSDAIGTTEVANTLMNAKLDVKTGWQAVHTASGRTDFSFIKQGPCEIKLDITFEHNGSATAEKANYRNGVARQLELKIEGSALTTAATYTYKTQLIKLAGKWESFDKLDEIDGNDVVTGHFVARYNSTAALFASFLNVNEVAVMP
jgi:hypothetical protein